MIDKLEGKAIVAVPEGYPLDIIQMIHTQEQKINEIIDLVNHKLFKCERIDGIEMYGADSFYRCRSCNGRWNSLHETPLCPNQGDRDIADFHST
jgi:hypothetical protein